MTCFTCKYCGRDNVIDSTDVKEEWSTDALAEVDEVSNDLVDFAPAELLGSGKDLVDSFEVNEDSAAHATGFQLSRQIYDNLYDHQRRSVCWLADMYHRSNGGILADEMGMGKTVQVVAFLAGLYASKLGRHFLVAVPLTLIENWRKECAIWAAECPIYVLHGTAKERLDALRKVYQTGGILVTSYDLVKHVMEEVRTVTQPKARVKRPRLSVAKEKKTTAFGDEFDIEVKEELDLEDGPLVEKENHPWDVVVLDEAQRVKNAGSKAGKALRDIRARTKLLLTGTPLQNNLKELWALMDLSMPGLLGNRMTFETSFASPIASGTKSDASLYDVQLKAQLSRRLKKVVAPHFLRRVKDTAWYKLPPKTDVLVWLKLTGDQENVYKTLLDTDLVKSARDQNNNSGPAAFRSIHLLQKMCNHPSLALKNTEFTEMMTSLGEAVISSNYEPDTEGWESMALQNIIPKSVEEVRELSSKCRFLSQLLPALHEQGHRVLLFSQSNKMLNLIQMCVLRPLQLKFLRIDGNLKPEDRETKIGKFESEEGREKFFCLCSSIRVGGVGIAITSADRVILVDPSWNPAAELQAIDRTHRLGQKKPVVVYRLFTSGSIEDKMFRYQIFKRGLVKSLLEEENQARYFTQKEMRELFTYGDKTLAFMEEKGVALGSQRIIDAVSDGERNALSSEDVEGFADYTNIFSTLEDADYGEDLEAEKKAQEAIEALQSKEAIETLQSKEAIETLQSKEAIEALQCMPLTDEQENAENLPPAKKKK